MKSKDKIINISYSTLLDLPIPWNTTELYETACKLGFDGIKGDVTPSSDGKLIMCHDPYFAIVSNGRALEPYQKGVKKKLIKFMSAEKCKSLEYANPKAKEHLGYYARVTELEDLVKVCKKYNKIAYITVRDKQIPLCVKEVYRVLKEYDMVDNAIVNSFSYETLSQMRKLDSNIKLSLVFGPDRVLTKQHIDKAAALKNCVVCVFWAKEPLFAGDLLKKSKNAMAYAKEKGVELHFAHGHDEESYKYGVECGFTAFQCLTSTAWK